MIFVGDIASPNFSTSSCLSKALLENKHIFFGRRLICNFEGLIYDGEHIAGNKPVLYNHSSVLRSLENFPRTVLCMANNHILDLPSQFETTARLLNERDFLYCGAGSSASEAEEPLVFYEGSQKIILLNACWDFLLYNHKNPRQGIHVSELQEEKLIERARNYKLELPECYIVVYLHWSFDLEVLPYPMFREFSKDLVDAGVNLVIGSHSHCVQGGERYKDGYIIYGLGNFYLPNHAYANSKLTFPDFSRIQLAFEWDIYSNDAVCHWLKYQDEDHMLSIIHLESASFDESYRMKTYSKFQGMNTSEYLAYFKKHRRKSFMIPIFTDYTKKRVNRIYTFLLKNRARFAHTLARLRLINWQN